MVPLEENQDQFLAGLIGLDGVASVTLENALHTEYPPGHTVLISYAHESGTRADHINSVNDQLEGRGLKVLWLFNSAYYPVADVQYLRADYFLHHTLYQIQGGHPVANPKLDGMRYLCMTGKLAHKPTRIRMLKSLWQAGMWRTGVISALHVAGCELPRQTPRRFDSALRVLAPLDQPTVPVYSDGVRWGEFAGWPVDVSLYERTRASCVIETWQSQHNYFFTEKLYRTMVMGHPFVLYAGLGHLGILKNRGYATYDWATGSYQEDDPKSVTAALQRLLACKDRTRLRRDAQHNQKHMQHLASQELALVREKISRFQQAG